jgi:hypothetical protein
MEYRTRRQKEKQEIRETPAKTVSRNHARKTRRGGAL